MNARSRSHKFHQVSGVSECHPSSCEANAPIEHRFKPRVYKERASFSASVAPQIQAAQERGNIDNKSQGASLPSPNSARRN